MNGPSDAGLVRAYVMAGGRASASRRLDLTSLVVAATGTQPDLGPEHRRIMALFGTRGALSVAEVSAHLQLPPSLVKILVADLMDLGCLATPTAHHGPPTDVLKEVLNGLRKLVA
ncbi:DUF742 domain-containing protein [Kitasatospora sp. NPDC059327]|uniref:DUF742 domain-containing protein n=1 Tax=Kitasatospora sp. NPDC059327 TaxID=3346803 RepID=UPI0036B30B39